MQTYFKNILAPTDFSALAGNAMATAIEMCKRHGACLHILHVLENQVMLSAPETIIPDSDIMSEKGKKSMEALSALVEKLEKKHQIKVISYLEYGNPVEAIGKKANELKCELIILGTHGASGFRELFIGSTAFTLIKNINIPVLTIPGKRKVKEFTKILFPISAAKGIIEKYDFIKPVIKRNNAELFILGLALSSEIFSPEDRRKELLQLGNSMSTNNVVFRSEFNVCNNYAREVLKVARKEKVNLIVIDAILDYNWTEFFKGPYVQQVVNHAQVPVLSIPIPEITRENESAAHASIFI